MPTYVYDATDLIAAINTANSDPNNVYEIEFGNDIDLDNPVGYLFGDVGTPVVIGQIIIDGAGFTIQRTLGQFRLFSVDSKNGQPSASLTLKNMRLYDGDADTSGSGAIINDGVLILDSCTISDCRGEANGGAIYNGDGCTMTVENCIFLNNYADGPNAKGGAIYNSDGGTLTISNTIFYNNAASGLGGQGGAIYQYMYGGVVFLYNCSFYLNSCDYGQNIWNDNTGITLNAIQCWWGDVTGPNGIDGASGHDTNTNPYRPTLPRFMPTPGVSENPCLPPSTSYFIEVTSSVGANVRRGPSPDDACITTYDITNNRCSNYAAQFETFPLRAYATDEDGDRWYGFEHPARPYYLSWIREDLVSINPPLPSPPDVPNFDTQSNTVWTNSLNIAGDPLERDFDTRRFRGFGNGEDLQTVYSSIANCSHPGLDFFPDISGSVKVRAVADGIVVGIGLLGDGRRATNWGAATAGANLIVRTGGHFVLYGELEAVEPHLYLGARVFMGERIATLADQGSNTHLHLEVDAYESGQDVNCLLRSHFGAVVEGPTTENPKLVIDPMYFISVKGDFDSTGATINNSTCTNPVNGSYTVSTYNDAFIDGKYFNYNVRTDLYLSGFNKTNGLKPNAEDCLTPTPGECIP